LILDANQQSLQILYDWHAADFTVFRRGDRIAANDYFLLFPINVIPFDPKRLGFDPHSAVSQKFDKVSHAWPPSAAFLAKIFHQCLKMRRRR
jgi:hypothetical protein